MVNVSLYGLIFRRRPIFYNLNRKFMYKGQSPFT